VMITGDHKITARVIGKEIGIIENRSDNIETGENIKNLSDSELNEIVKNTKIFARISPEDKLRIVKAFQQQNEIVAMTGDGVNDAPAVKEADIGVAMGENGTDVTREVSSLILRDDNFATIVAAIKQGRIIYNNIRKFIRYLLSCNIGELLSIFIGIVLGLPLPLLPIQILWVNLVTDGLPALALGMEESGEEIMNQPPRNPDESVFAHGMVPKILSQGMLIGISTIFAFLLAIFKLEAGVITARTMAFSTLVFSQLFFVFSCRSENRSVWQMSPLGNKYLIFAVFLSIIMQLLVIYHPFLNELFQTTILNTNQWIIVLIFSSWSTIIMEIIQSIIKRISYTSAANISENYFF
ncbi:MAG: HAD-IC family P-type ATPase, partial [Bacillota bacterium]